MVSRSVIQNEEIYDAIVIGLGCAGLSTTYALAKKGLKVLGFEKEATSGSTESSSQGDTRVWYLESYSEEWTKLMADALELWREAEKESNQKLVVNSPEGMLWVLDHDDNTYFVLKKKGKKITNQEMKEQFPRLSHLPDDMIGFLQNDSGLIMSATSLKVFHELSIKHGAELHYSTPIKSIDIATGKVTLDNDSEDVYFAKNIIISCGIYESPFFPTTEKLPKMENINVRLVNFESNDGLPMCISFYSKLHKDLCYLFGMYDGGDSMLEYKFGYDSKEDLGKIEKTLNKYFPSTDQKKHRECVCPNIKHSDMFVLKRIEKSIYLYGLGRGFKIMPLYGEHVAKHIIL